MLYFYLVEINEPAPNFQIKTKFTFLHQKTLIKCFNCKTDNYSSPFNKKLKQFHELGEEPWSSGESRRLMIKRSEFEPRHRILDGCKRC